MLHRIHCRPVLSSSDWRAFDAVPRAVYMRYPCHRATEDDVMRLVTRGSQSFLSHASVRPFLLLTESEVAGRFVLIQDARLPLAAQIAFFEAMPGLGGVRELLRSACRKEFPSCRRMVVGLNGHVNYGAGLLTENFDSPPVFGLPYTPPYYLDYFESLDRHGMASYRFETAAFHAYAAGRQSEYTSQPVRIRTMRKCALMREVGLYTRLNNACFLNTAYWSERTPEEDHELLHPFRWFIDEENLLFAERENDVVGFLLWYPDFNELTAPGETLGLKHLLKYRLGARIHAFRLAEIGVVPEYQNTTIAHALIMELSRLVKKAGHTHCEAGFIFDDNGPSTVLTRRYIKRAIGVDAAPYRRFAVFEDSL